MRRWNVLMAVLVGVLCFGRLYGAGGDMGLETEPLTDGSESYPFLIEDMADFDAFRDPCNASNYCSVGVHIWLSVDLDLSDAGDNDNGSFSRSVIGWDSELAYEGCLDGNGKTISGLTVQGAEVFGLFREIGENGCVKNLKIMSSANVNEGALICYKNSGMIQGCSVNGTIEGPSIAGICIENRGVISNCDALYMVYKGTYFGGICQENYNTVSGCTVEGKLIGIQNRDYSNLAGGIVGSNFKGRIEECHAEIDMTCPFSIKGLIGGICAGSDIGELEDCSFKGTIRDTYNDDDIDYGDADQAYGKGGLVGWLCGGRMTGCISEGTVQGDVNVGGLCGRFSGQIDRCYSFCDVEGDYYCAGGIGHLEYYYDYDMGQSYDSTIEQSMAYGEVKGKDYIAGFCAYNYGIISQCYSYCDVVEKTELRNYTGGSDLRFFSGFTCSNNGDIVDCCAFGSVKGNVAVGFNVFSGNLQNCYAAVELSGEDEVGFGFGDNVSNCLWDIDVSGMESAPEYEQGIALSTGDMRNEATYAGYGWDMGVSWVMSDESRLFGGRAMPGWVGQMSDRVMAIRIKGPETILANGETNEYECFVILENAIVIDVTDEVIWNRYGDNIISINYAFAPYTMQLEAAYHEVCSGGDAYHEASYNIDVLPVAITKGDGSIDDPYLIETVTDFMLFAWDHKYHSPSAYVKLMSDLDFKDYLETYDFGGYDRAFSGAIINEFYGNFNGNGHVLRNISIKSDGDSCGVFGNLGGDVYDLGIEKISIESEGYFVGGLCGLSGLENSIERCYVTGDIRGLQEVGGLCGRAVRCFIRDCYTRGRVGGESYVGALVGNGYHGDIENCYSDSTIVTDSMTGLLIGNDISYGNNYYFSDSVVSSAIQVHPVEDGRYQEMFQDWDFDTVWDIVEGQSMPFLRKGIRGDVNGDGIVNMDDLAVLAENWLVMK